MTDSKQTGRIAAETIEAIQPWILPPVNDNGRVLSTVEKEAKERKEALLRKSKESIQTIEMPDQTSPLKGMTAEELEKIFADAEQDGFTKGHAEGFERGRADGYEAGRQQGLKEMRDQLTAEQRRFESIANALLQPLQQQDDAIENLMVNIICHLTQNVIQREMQIDSSHILQLVHTAIDELPIGSKNIRVVLNPVDLQKVEDYVQEQQLEWKLFGDAQLTPGGCRVETAESRVDFSISSRLQSVLEQFLTGQLSAVDESNEQR